jgi:hypothetical protein
MSSRFFRKEFSKASVSLFFSSFQNFNQGIETRHIKL